jgi:hypothetical protein
MPIVLVGSAPRPPRVDDLLVGDSSTFASSIGSWTASGGTLTRDTTAAYEWPLDRPGSLKFVTTGTGEYVSCPVGGKFVAGIEYQAFFAVAVEEAAATYGAAFELYFGEVGVDAGVVILSDGAAAFLNGKYVTFVVRWTPTAPRTNTTLRLKRTDSNTQTLTYHLGYVRVTRLTRPSEAGFIIGAEPVDSSLQSGMALVAFPSAADIRLGAAGVSDGGVSFNRSGAVSIANHLGSNYVTAAAGAQGIYIGAEGAPAGDLAGTGVGIVVGPSGVGFVIGEKDANTIQLYPDVSGGYDIQLRDRGSRHWQIVSADGLTVKNLIDAGGMSSDSLWDAAGDLAVGTGANTAGRLAKGNDNDVLMISASTHLPVWAAPTVVGSYADGEVPSGTINGSNPTFTLAHTPTIGSVQLFKNGLRQRSGSGNDYTISTATITFESASIPQTGDILLADYRY